MRHAFLTAAGLTLATFGHYGEASAQSSTGYLGDTILMANTYCPHTWLPADGRALSINQYPRLSALLQQTYGGDGRTTFFLPDLRGRIAVHLDTSGTLPLLDPGLKVGTTTQRLSETQMPAHSHSLLANLDGTNSVSPANHSLSRFTTPGAIAYAEHPSAFAEMDVDTIGETGDEMPFDVTSPTLGLLYCVNTEGLWPPRN